MLKLNVHEAKTHLSRYLDRLEAGETILLCRRNVPIAQISPLPKTEAAAGGERPFGLYRGRIRIAADFDVPLSPEETAQFYDAPLVTSWVANDRAAGEPEKKPAPSKKYAVSKKKPATAPGRKRK